MHLLLLKLTEDVQSQSYVAPGYPSEGKREAIIIIIEIVLNRKYSKQRGASKGNRGLRWRSAIVLIPANPLSGVRTTFRTTGSGRMPAKRRKSIQFISNRCGASNGI